MKISNSLKKSNNPNQIKLYPHDTLEKRFKEGLFIILQIVAVFLMAAFISYNGDDAGWSRTGTELPIHNSTGAVGAWIADFMLYIFGYLAYLFPVMISYAGFLAFNNRQNKIHSWLLCTKVIGFLLALMGGCGLASLHFKPILLILPKLSGGILGDLLNSNFIELLNYLGSTLLYLTAFLVGITLALGLSWLAFADYIGNVAIKVSKFIYALSRNIIVHIYRVSYMAYKKIKTRKMVKEKFITPIIQANTNKPSIIKTNTNKAAVNIGKNNSQYPNENINAKTNNYKKVQNNKKSINNIKNTDLPDINLLDEVSEQQDINQWSKEELTQLSNTVEAKLQDFGIMVKVAAVYPGPVITRFELQLSPGIKASKITALSRDLARSLSVISVRVVEVIPGKSVVGLEIPNQQREIVRLRDLIESKLYQENSKPLTLALGKDIAGEPVTVDLAKMPHLLIAGTTGSGKSVGVNAILLSLLYKSTPEQLRLILIDPKMLELSIYEWIPHLLTPVVTDMKDAAHALKWCVAEMERRYQLMATIGVRNLLGYNKKVTEAAASGKPLFDPFWNKVEGEEPPILEPLPYIVVIIDEFADMIMVVGKKVEELIARIAQKARAAGIHLILATQRPSVDVITGLIKANIPARIAFQVSSKIDSRTILDQQGADQLLGYGDMLYLAPGLGIPKRVHGAFVSDDEVNAVVKALKSNIKEPNYIEDLNINNTIPWNNVDLFDNEQEQDPLYDEAVFIVTKSRKASVSNLQRRLKIGYNRAARLVEDMEASGIVSAMQSNGSREVLVAEPIEN